MASDHNLDLSEFQLSQLQNEGRKETNIFSPIGTYL